MGNPFLGVDHLPALVLVGTAGSDIRMVAHHAVPAIRITFLKSQALGIWPVTQDDGILPFFDRSEDIRPQHKTVVHDDLHVPVNPHSVRDFRSQHFHFSSFHLDIGRLDDGSPFAQVVANGLLQFSGRATKRLQPQVQNLFLDVRHSHDGANVVAGLLHGGR